MNTTGDYKHRMKRNLITNLNLYSYRSDDLLFATVLAGGNFAGGGLLSVPPASLSHSYPPAVLGFRPPENLRHHRQQPPLLPLPLPNQNMNIYRANSISNKNIRTNKNVKNRVRDHSLTPKKSKNQKKSLKREDTDPVSPAVAVQEKKASPVTESSISEVIGPDPKDLPKDVISRVFASSVDKFSGSVVFTPSPPPSSLPLPTFSLRPKLGCNTEAAAVASGVDAGATDSLRRLLRL